MYSGPVHIQVNGGRRGDPRLPFLVSRGRVLLGPLFRHADARGSLGILSDIQVYDDGSYVRVTSTPYIKTIQVYMAPPVPPEGGEEPELRRQIVCHTGLRVQTTEESYFRVEGLDPVRDFFCSLDGVRNVAIKGVEYYQGFTEGPITVIDVGYLRGPIVTTDWHFLLGEQYKDGPGASYLWPPGTGRFWSMRRMRCLTQALDLVGGTLVLGGLQGNCQLHDTTENYWCIRLGNEVDGYSLLYVHHDMYELNRDTLDYDQASLTLDIWPRPTAPTSEHVEGEDYQRIVIPATELNVEYGYNEDGRTSWHLLDFTSDGRRALVGYSPEATDMSATSRPAIVWYGFFEIEILGSEVGSFTYNIIEHDKGETLADYSGPESSYTITDDAEVLYLIPTLTYTRTLGTYTDSNGDEQSFVKDYTIVFDFDNQKPWVEGQDYYNEFQSSGLDVYHSTVAPMFFRARGRETDTRVQQYLYRVNAFYDSNDVVQYTTVDCRRNRTRTADPMTFTAAGTIQVDRTRNAHDELFRTEVTAPNFLLTVQGSIAADYETVCTIEHGGQQFTVRSDEHTERHVDRSATAKKEDATQSELDDEAAGLLQLELAFEFTDNSTTSRSMAFACPDNVELDTRLKTKDASSSTTATPSYEHVTTEWACYHDWARLYQLYLDRGAEPDDFWGHDSRISDDMLHTVFDLGRAMEAETGWLWDQYFLSGLYGVDTYLDRLGTGRAVYFTFYMNPYDSDGHGPVDIVTSPVVTPSGIVGGLTTRGSLNPMAKYQDYGDLPGNVDDTHYVDTYYERPDRYTIDGSYNPKTGQVALGFPYPVSWSGLWSDTWNVDAYNPGGRVGAPWPSSAVVLVDMFYTDDDGANPLPGAV